MDATALTVLSGRFLELIMGGGEMMCNFLFFSFLPWDGSLSFLFFSFPSLPDPQFDIASVQIEAIIRVCCLSWYQQLRKHEMREREGKWALVVRGL